MSSTAARQTHYRTCPLCEATCGLEVTTEGDQIVRIRGDQADPVSRGFICPKGSTLKQLHVDPDRLRAPVVRTGEGWQEVTWDEAFAEIARRLAPIVEDGNRQAMAAVLGNPNVHNLGGSLYLRQLLMAIGSTNIFSASTVDQMPKHVSAGLMWGDTGMFPLPDLDRTDYLLMLGANPYVSNGSLVTVPDFPGKLKAIQERGGRFVVLDPRRSKTAAEADEHIRIQPGTDILWLLALINVLFEQDLVDIGRLAEHTAGVDDVRDAVEAYTPEMVASRCRVEADVTRRIARELAGAEAAAVYGRIGIHTVEYGTLASWATDVLNVLTGNLDRPGGIMFNSAPTMRLDQRKPGGRGFTTGRWNGRASGRPEVNGELPAATLAEEIETPGPGQIRALFLVASNPVRSFPNSTRLDAAFAQLDLLVAVDPYINASSRHAHVILPPRSALERSHYDMTFERNMLRSFAKYSPPVFGVEAPDEPEILCRLAVAVSAPDAGADPYEIHTGILREMVRREVTSESSPIAGREVDEIMAVLDSWSWAEQIVDLKLRTGRFGDGFGANPEGLTLKKLCDDHPHGVDFGPLQQRLPDAIKTRSGCVELMPEPLVAELDRLEHGLPGAAGLVLVGRRHLRSCNTWMHNVDVLVKGRERCTLQVHPEDAERYGLADGGKAIVRSRVGRVTAPVEVCDSIMTGVVSLPFGWGYDTPGIEMQVARVRPGINSNELTDDASLDDASGTAILNAIPVEVGPA